MESGTDGSGVGGERVEIGRRRGVGGERVEIYRGGGGGETGVGRSGVEGGESGDRQEEEWVGEGKSGDRSGVEGGEWG